MVWEVGIHLIPSVPTKDFQIIVYIRSQRLSLMYMEIIVLIHCWFPIQKWYLSASNRRPLGVIWCGSWYAARRSGYGLRKMAWKPPAYFFVSFRTDDGRSYGQFLLRLWNGSRWISTRVSKVFDGSSADSIRPDDLRIVFLRYGWNVGHSLRSYEIA